MKISAATLRTAAYNDRIPAAEPGNTTAYYVTPKTIVQSQISLYNVISYGALGDGSTDDRAAIQSAIDAANTAGGGTIYFPPNSTAYMLTKASGEHPFRTGKKYCLQIYSNVHLYIPTGAIIKLANSQMTDAGGYVDMIVAEDASNIMIYGGGRITGNTSGQTGWSGGYGQHGSQIAVYANSAITDLRFYDLMLDDHFGEALQIDAATRIISRVWIENLYINNCGGGVYCNRIDQVSVKNCFLPDTNDVMEQDAIEVSNSINWTCSGCYVDNSSTGNSCFELYGSTRGVLSDFVAIGLIPVNDVPLAGGIDDPADLIIKDGYIAGTSTSSDSCIGIALGGVTVCTGRISNVKITGCKYGILISSSGNAVSGPLTIDNCDISGCSSGLFIKSITDLNVIGGHYDSNTYFGIYVTDNTANVHDRMNISGIEAHGNAVGINIISSCASTGQIVGCNLTGNSSYPIAFDYDATSAKFLVAGNQPDYNSHVVAYPITGYRVFDPTDASITTFARPSMYQQMLIKVTRNQTFVDKTQSGGVNIKLAGSANLSAVSGNYLCLQYDGADWVEMWRRT